MSTWALAALYVLTTAVAVLGRGKLRVDLDPPVSSISSRSSSLILVAVVVSATTISATILVVIAVSISLTGAAALVVGLPIGTVSIIIFRLRLLRRGLLVSFVEVDAHTADSFMFDDTIGSVESRLPRRRHRMKESSLHFHIR